MKTVSINNSYARKFLMFRSIFMQRLLFSFFSFTSLTVVAQSLPAGKEFSSVSYIPAKTFNGLAFSGIDSTFTYNPRTVSVNGFYILKTEVTNKEYREFRNYVRDSIAHTLLQHFIKGSKQLDWTKKIAWKDSALAPMLIPPEENLTGRPGLDPNSFRYELKLESGKEVICISPDTLTWISDFSYSYNEHLVKRYFSHPDYDEYPVVGIDLKQAMAFCQWKTVRLNQSLKNEKYKWEVRLPTNHEWESAARDDEKFELMKSLRFTSNFGQIVDKGFVIKDYDDDGFFYTNKVKYYPPNKYGLFGMEGNVAEWTTSGSSDIAANGQPGEKNIIAKGGGWDSSPFYLQPGVCQFFSPRESHCYLGFRYVIRKK